MTSGLPSEGEPSSISVCNRLLYCEEVSEKFRGFLENWCLRFVLDLGGEYGGYVSCET